MTEIRYGDMAYSPDGSCNGMGSIPGPTGEGWQVVALMPLGATVPQGAGQYAVIVNGKITGVNVAGAGLLAGRMEVCLGIYGAGTRLAHLTTRISALNAYPTWHGALFQFVLIVSSATSDPTLGTSLNLHTQRLCLFARTWRGGDPSTYLVTFGVDDISWLWWDLGRIPAGDQFVYRHSSTSDHFGASEAAPLTRASGTFPTDGNWLIFQNYRYQPDSVFSQPRVKAGYAGSFSLTRLGNEHRWGHNYSPVNATPIYPIQHHGWFCVDGLTTGNTVTNDFFDAGSPGIRTWLFTWSMVAIRLNSLWGSWTQSFGQRAVGIPETLPWWTVYSQALERPGGIVVTEPLVLAHCHPEPQNFTGYRMQVTENLNPNIAFGEGKHQRVGLAWRETVSQMAIGKRQFQIASPTMQWHAHVLGQSDARPEGVWGYTNQVIQFHPVKDPENIWIPPPTIPDTTYVTPGRQAVVAGLLTPPSAPNANPLQRRQGPVRAEIEALYRRSWLVGGAPERIWSLTWGPMPIAEALAVRDFLVANATWMYRAPKATSPIPVLNLNRPQMTKVDHRVGMVSVEVVELYYTG